MWPISIFSVIQCVWRININIQWQYIQYSMISVTINIEMTESQWAMIIFSILFNVVMQPDSAIQRNLPNIYQWQYEAIINGNGHNICVYSMKTKYNNQCTKKAASYLMAEILWQLSMCNTIFEMIINKIMKESQ